MTLNTKKFQSIIWDYYKQEKRGFPWRETTNPYHIIVSEIMLQQTQTHRVIEKYENFINLFPNFKTLASASLRSVLTAWQGLGYNRRAIALQKCAQKVMNEFNGTLPDDEETLLTFPGIGSYTAASICAFAHNQPTVCIETNIRAVYIHFFFQDKAKITDKQLYPIIEKTIDTKNARHWYYALMDYGVMLKKKHKNPTRKSAHYTQQSKFEGSDRQIRGNILKLLTSHPALPYNEIVDILAQDHERVKKIIMQLIKEGFIKKRESFFYIA